MMKITFILPGIGRKKNEKYLKSWLMEPLTIAVLNKLTPERYQRNFFDDRIENIDYGCETDVVAITVETYTARRAYEIAEKFKQRGKIVVMGGYHATLAEHEVIKHADIVVKGNAEEVWAGVLLDIENKSFKKVYEGKANIDYGLPDRSIYVDKQKKYLPITLVEIGRGCRHLCEFCSIHSYYSGQYMHRKISDIVEEIKMCRNKIYFFVDDSIFSDREFAKELFKEVEKLNIIWSARLGERDELVERIHMCGISIYASFVFGFDYDNEESFLKNLEFCSRHEFFVTAFNHLLAFPGTETYERFLEEGRLFHESWWLEKGYTFGTISFMPKLVSDFELKNLCRKYKKKYYTFFSILKRGITLLRRTRKPLINMVYWYQNILFHFEVDKRFGIPIGENMDEVIDEVINDK